MIFLSCILYLLGKVLAFQDTVQHLNIGRNIHRLGAVERVQLVFKGSRRRLGVAAQLGLDLGGVLAPDAVLVMHRAKIAMYDTVEKVFAHAQQLLELGLSVPQVTQIFLKLRQMGLDIPADVYTIPYAVKTIRRALAAKQAGEVQ